MVRSAGGVVAKVSRKNGSNWDSLLSLRCHHDIDGDGKTG